MDQFTRRSKGFGAQAGAVDGIALCCQSYDKTQRTRRSRSGDTSSNVAERTAKLQAALNNYRWQPHCRGLNQPPVAA
jgi:hypothetical protein